MDLRGVVVIVLVCLATYRITRLITTDSFPPILAFRDWVADRYGEDSWQVDLSTCPWCVSVYVGGALCGACWTFLPYPLLVWPVASAATGLIASREGVD